MKNVKHNYFNKSLVVSVLSTNARRRRNGGLMFTSVFNSNPPLKPTSVQRLWIVDRPWHRDADPLIKMKIAT